MILLLLTPLALRILREFRKSFFI